MNKVHFSMQTNEWTTPQDLYDELNTEFKFTLDPCCTIESAKCDKFYTKKENGLIQDWSVDIVFMNPPYAREIPKWIEKQVFKRTDMAFPLSQNAVQILANRGYTGPSTVFPNGVDISLFRPLDSMTITDQQSVAFLKHSLNLNGCFVIGYVGRLLHMKGIDILFRSVKKEYLE